MGKGEIPIDPLTFKTLCSSAHPETKETIEKVPKPKVIPTLADIYYFESCMAEWPFLTFFTLHKRNMFSL